MDFCEFYRIALLFQMQSCYTFGLNGLLSARLLYIVLENICITDL
jgi:hypothetical protein